MSQQGYEIKPVKEEDTEAVMVLLRHTFFLDEPMNESVGLCVGSRCDELEEYCSSALRAGLSLKAVDSSGNIAGVMISERMKLNHDDHTNHYLNWAQNCTNPKFQKILYVLAQREEGAKLAEKYPQDKELVDVKIAATDPNWRKRGIMNALLNETEKLTTQLGIRLLRMDTSSAYSAMSAEKLGFTCIYTAAYADIKMDGQPILLPKPPHTHDSVYIKILEIKKD